MYVECSVKDRSNVMHVKYSVNDRSNVMHVKYSVNDRSNVMHVKYRVNDRSNVMHVKYSVNDRSNPIHVECNKWIRFSTTFTAARLTQRGQLRSCLQSTVFFHRRFRGNPSFKLTWDVNPCSERYYQAWSFSLEYAGRAGLCADVNTFVETARNRNTRSKTKEMFDKGINVLLTIIGS